MDLFNDEIINIGRSYSESGIGSENSCSDQLDSNNDIVDTYINENISDENEKLNYSIESEAGDFEVQAKEKKTRKRYEWKDHASFETMTDAHMFLIEKGFAKRDKKILTDKSAKTKYRCTNIKRRSKIQCECEYIIYEPSNVPNLFIVQHNGRDHSHNESENEDKSTKFSKELVDLITDCSKKRMTAKKIIEHVNDLKEKFNLFSSDKTPTAQQIYYFIRKNKIEEAPDIISIGELVEWCSNRSNIPDDEDEAFVLDFVHSQENQQPFFRFAVSTLRLLSNCVGLDQVCCDATYKLMWQGFPFLVIGTVDRAKKFHPLCFACTSTERQEDFEFFFQALKSSVEKFYEEPFSPRILIADGAHSIRNAFETVFPDSVEKMIMCYAHVVRNVAKRTLNDKNNKSAILNDISQMNLAKSEMEFNMLSKWFLKKWNNTEPEFADYFENTWLGSHCNWFEAASVFSPSHNNGLEGRAY